MQKQHVSSQTKTKTTAVASFLFVANVGPGWSVLDPVRLLSVVIQTSASVFNWARCL
jgi:hypothetical protein